MQTNKFKTVSLFFNPLKRLAPSGHIGSDNPKRTLSRKAATMNPLQRDDDDVATKHDIFNVELSSLFLRGWQRPVHLSGSPATAGVSTYTSARTISDGGAAV